MICIFILLLFIQLQYCLSNESNKIHFSSERWTCDRRRVHGSRIPVRWMPIMHALFREIGKKVKGFQISFYSQKDSCNMRVCRTMTTLWRNKQSQSAVLHNNGEDSKSWNWRWTVWPMLMRDLYKGRLNNKGRKVKEWTMTWPKPWILHHHQQQRKESNNNKNNLWCRFVTFGTTNGGVT